MDNISLTVSVALGAAAYDLTKALISAEGWSFPAALVAAAAIHAAYASLTRGGTALFDSSQWLRRTIFGKHYFEGDFIDAVSQVDIPYCIGITSIEIQSGGISLSGRNYTVAGQPLYKWSSLPQLVQLNGREIQFAYKIDYLNSNETRVGIAQIHLTDNKSRTRVYGYVGRYINQSDGKAMKIDGVHILSSDELPASGIEVTRLYHKIHGHGKDTELPPPGVHRPAHPNET